MARKPVVRIIGPSGGDIVVRLGRNLVNVKTTDMAGSESDEMSFIVRVKPPFPAGPPKGVRYLCELGWEGDPFRLTGIYTVQNHSLAGDPEQGYSMTVTSRATDFLDKMKEVDSEHFDDMTVGDIFRKIAEKAGMTAIVDQTLAAVKIPYRLRWNQSHVDFASDLSAELGGTMKLAGGKLVVMARGAGRSAGGTALPVIKVPFSSSYGFEISVETRGEYKDTGGEWFDPAAGISKLQKTLGLGELSRYLPVHPFASEDEAKRAGEAGGREQARQTVSGSFDMAGNPLAIAEAPVKPSGYGDEIDGLDLVASSVTHDVTFDDSAGWVTTVEIENRADAAAKAAKKSKEKKPGGGLLPDTGTVPDWQIPPGGPNAPG
jgi:uncharacterized protein